MALNGTQKNLIEGLLKTYLDDILMINLDDAIRALNAVFQENISAEDETFFKEKIFGKMFNLFIEFYHTLVHKIE